MKNKLTFGMLPQREAFYKLMQASFSTPQKNLAVYRFCQKAYGLLDFLETERSKLVKKYGDPTGNGSEYMIPTPRLQEYRDALKTLFDTEIEEEMVLGMTEEDFENCQYPADKTLWLNAGEISFFLRFANKEKSDGVD